MHDSTDPDPPLEDAPRPLYLAPGEETFVGLDGPALRVSRPDRAEQMFPLRRIGRIHTNDHVEWETRALLACAGHGIPIVFLDDDARVQARLLGRPGQRDELRTRLLEFLLQPHAIGCLHHWLKNARKDAALRAAFKLRLDPASLDIAAIREAVNRCSEEYAGPRAAQHTRQWLRTLAYVWMEEHLRDLGLGRSNELAQCGEFNLAAELTNILYWYLEPARIGWLRRRFLAARRKHEPVQPPGQRQVIHLFESRATQVARHGRRISSQLHRWLIHET